MKVKNIIILFFCLLQFALCKLQLNAQIWNTIPISLNNHTIPGSHPQILTIDKIDSLLYVGGGFLFAGNISTNNIAVWNGTTWDSLGTGDNSSSGVKDICKFNNEIYKGGNWFMRWDGYDWATIGTGLNTSGVNALLNYKNKLYIGGNGYILNGTNIHNITCWNDTIYEGLNSGVRGAFEEVRALKIFNEKLVVAGQFAYAGSNEAFNIASWDGSTWNAMDTGIGGEVYSLAVDTINNFLYVGGGFESAGGPSGVSTLSGIARWDGFKWDSLCNNIIMYPSALNFYQNKLFVGGTFYGQYAITPSGDTLNHIAYWDGQKWNALGKGVNSTVLALQVYNDELYIGGTFTTAGNDSAFGIARWYMPPDTTCDYLQAIIHPQNTTYYTNDSVGIPFYNNITLASSWHWNFGDGELDSMQKPFHNYHNAGVYAVSVIVNYKNCWDTASTVITIKPCDSLIAQIYTQNDTVYYNTSPVTVNFSSNANADSWQWSFSDGGSNSGNTVMHSYSTAGIYQVSVIISQGSCTDTSTLNLTVINNTGILEGQKDNTIYLWQNIPNPFNNTTTVPYFVPEGTKGSLHIIGTTGKIIKEYNLLQGKNDHDVSLSQLKPGVYYYSIFINGIKKQTLMMLLE